MFVPFPSSWILLFDRRQSYKYYSQDQRYGLMVKALGPIPAQHSLRALSSQETSWQENTNQNSDYEKVIFVVLVIMVK